MNYSRTALALVAILPLLAAGCGGADTPDVGTPAAGGGAPAARYAPRTDLLAIAIPDGAPTHWPAAGYPPLRSARLFPNTPDRDLAADLRKQLGKTVLDPTDVSILTPTQADQIARLTEAQFGTPLAPTVRLPSLWETAYTEAVRSEQKEPKEWFQKFLVALQKSGADWFRAAVAREELKVDDVALARGGVVYRRWCMQCHGANGSGEPAHAVEAGPMPRDYRQGVFKFTTAFPPPDLKKKGLGPVGKARRVDLLRTVRNGIEGTIMPAFPTLTEQEVEDVVSYVVHLAVRGETEFATLAKITNVNKLTENDPDFVGGELDWLFAQNELWVLLNWGVAAQHPIPIPPEPFATEPERSKSAVRGYKLYNSSEFGCASCHANYGRAPQLKWDAWGTVVQPRNLTLGVYRGGRKGEDLYARIYGGIGPSGMTAFHDRVKAAAPGTPDKIWDIVHFLQALGDPADRRRMQRLDSEVKLEP